MLYIADKDPNPCLTFLENGVGCCLPWQQKSHSDFPNSKDIKTWRSNSRGEGNGGEDLWSTQADCFIQQKLTYSKQEKKLKLCRIICFQIIFLIAKRIFSIAIKPEALTDCMLEHNLLGFISQGPASDKHCVLPPLADHEEAKNSSLLSNMSSNSGRS